MANKPLTMLQYIDYYKFWIQAYLGVRSQKQLSITCNTVDAYCRRFKASGKSNVDLLQLLMKNFPS